MLLRATFVGVAIFHTVGLYAQDADIKERLKGVDLSGAGSLTLSPNEERVAGLTVLYGKSGPGSLIKIWAIKEKRLLHTFRVPGKAHSVAFSPDGSTVVTADGIGNLGWLSTIRAWDLVTGKEREVGTCIGEIGDFCFSPDGSQLASLVNVSSLEAAALQKETGFACLSQINVWRVVDDEKVLSINITDPRGRGVELWPPVKDAEARKRIAAAIRRIVPTKLCFSPNGRRLISETDAGVRTIHDSQTGKPMGPTNTCSVGMFMAMQIIALHEVPADVTEFTVDLQQSGTPILMNRRADGWWQASINGKGQRYGCKVEGGSYVAMEGDVEKKEDISILLGVDEDMKLAELVSVKHPLGVIQIVRKKASLEFRLEEQADGGQTGTTLQRGKVRWEVRE